MKLNAAAELALYRTKAITAYSLDEARDDHGRWTTDGGLADKGDDTAVRVSDLVPKNSVLKPTTNKKMSDMANMANASGWKTTYSSESGVVLEHSAFPGQLNLDSYGKNKDNPKWEYTTTNGKSGRAARTVQVEEGQGLGTLLTFLQQHREPSAEEAVAKLAPRFANNVSIPAEYAAKARNDMLFVSMYPDVMKLLENRPLKEIAYVSRQPGNDTLATYNAKGANHGSYGKGSGRVAVRGTDKLDYQGEYTPASKESRGIHNVGGDLLDIEARSGSTLLHEIGHHVQEQFATRSDFEYGDGLDKSMYQRNYDAYTKAVGASHLDTGGIAISRYAKTNPAEYFAENFTAYHLYPERLKSIDPDGYAVVDRVVNDNQKRSYF